MRRTVARATAVAVALVGAAVPVVGASGASARARTCGTISAGGARYKVVETQGTQPCRGVRSAATHFLSRGSSPSGWHCFRNNASSGQRFAASCSRGRAVVRIYVKR